MSVKRSSDSGASLGSAGPPALAIAMPLRALGPRERELCRALQEIWARRPFEWLVADASGGALGAQERASWPALRSLAIHRSELDDGDTRNLLVAETSAALVLLIDERAELPRGDWLVEVERAFAAPEVAAVLAPARGIGVAQAWPELAPEVEPALFALRRSLWERHPFPRAPIGACAVLSRAVKAHGLSVVELGPWELRRELDAAGERFRARALGWLAASHGIGQAPVSREDSLRQARAAGERALAERRALCARGLWEGSRGVERERPSRVLQRGRPLSILFVVHGFPPESWAGTEVYTLSLAREIQRLGHKVSILTRSPATRAIEQGGPPDFALFCDQFQDLRVWRMVHRIEHKNLRESYQHPRAEDRFREVLVQERPDVVHFQHLLHFSAALPRLAKERGIPSVLTCNDYWALCARVQMIRPDGVRCEENQGLGCLVCVKHKQPERIALARQALPLATPLIPLARFFAEHPRIPSVKVRRRLAKVEHARATLLSRWGRAWEHIRARQPFVLSGYAAADVLIAPSRFLRAKYLHTGSFDPRRFVYSDYGMRTSDVRSVSRTLDPRGRLRLGFIGSLVWYKGADVLIRAVQRLAARKLVLKVHGSFRPEQDEHHALLERLARGGPVEFCGVFDNQRLAEVYSEIDVLIVPSVWFENSPLTIHEAFLYRTPVVTSGIGGMAELVRDGVDGLHFAAGDDADLARVLARLMDEPGLLARLSQAVPRVKSIEENAREMEYRYRWLVCSRAQPRRELIGGDVRPVEPSPPLR
jgi:glycosyltransferase involved in cell wall biosynthesis